MPNYEDGWILHDLGMTAQKGNFHHFNWLSYFEVYEKDSPNGVRKKAETVNFYDKETEETHTYSVPTIDPILGGWHYERQNGHEGSDRYPWYLDESYGYKIDPNGNDVDENWVGFDYWGNNYNTKNGREYLEFFDRPVGGSLLELDFITILIGVKNDSDHTGDWVNPNGNTAFSWRYYGASKSSDDVLMFKNSNHLPENESNSEFLGWLSPQDLTQQQHSILSSYINNIPSPSTQTPEPSTIILFGIGLLCFTGIIRKRN